MIMQGGSEAEDYRFCIIPLEDLPFPQESVIRSTNYRILQVQKNSGELIRDLHAFSLREGAFYFIAPGQIYRLKGTVTGNFVSFGEGYAAQMIKYIPPLFSLHHTQPFLLPTPLEQEELATLLSLLGNEHRRNPKDMALIASLLQSFLIFCARIRTGIVKKSFTRKQTRMAEIESLIEAHYRQEHFAPFYAERLNLNPHYLNRLLKNALGKTLTTLIAERIVLEAKRELVHSTRSIHDIADSLGFYDPSYFSKFFKKYESLSPRIFRERFRYYH